MVESLTISLEEAIQARVTSVADMLDLQYNVFTAENCCRGIYYGLEVAPPKAITPRSKRAGKQLTKAEAIGIDFGRAELLTARLLGTLGDAYLARFLELLLPVAERRAKMAAQVREKKRNKSQGENRAA